MANQIQLRVLIPPREKKDKFVGLFLSFLSAVSEVTDGTRKATFLNQFYRERLDKNEKRLLSATLGQLLIQLNKMNESERLNESSSIEDDFKIPQEILKLFHNFRVNERFDFEGAASFSSGSLNRQSYRTKETELQERLETE